MRFTAIWPGFWPEKQYSYGRERLCALRDVRVAVRTFPREEYSPKYYTARANIIRPNSNLRTTYNNRPPASPETFFELFLRQCVAAISRSSSLRNSATVDASVASWKRLVSS